MFACHYEEGIPNHVYAVTVKPTLVPLSAPYRGRFQQPVLCFCVGVVQSCVRSQAAGERHCIYPKET